jgi:pyruvate kinase
VLKSLKDILQRSGTHHTKKRYTFRPMQIAKDFFGDQKMQAENGQYLTGNGAEVK